jgi:hypothetical protein
MKYSYLIVIFLLNTCVFFACNREPGKVGDLTKTQMLRDNDSKTWQLVKMYVRDTLYELSEQELLYTVTYKSDNTFVDSDGMFGTYQYDEVSNKITETLTTGGTGKFTYKVESLSAFNLVLRLIDNGSGNPNIQYHYNAK